MTPPPAPRPGVALARATSGSLCKVTDAAGRNPGLEALMAKAIIAGAYETAALIVWLAKGEAG